MPSGVKLEFSIAFPMSRLKLPGKRKLGGGFSGPSVVGNRVFVTDFILKNGTVNNIPSGREQVTGQERVLCLDATTGKEIWAHAYDVEYRVSYPAGPRTSPQVQGDKVYTLGTDGDLLCLDIETGKVLWSRQFKTDFDAATPFWGHSAHPLVYQNSLICMVGGQNATVVAFDLETGRELWKSLNAKEPGYAPPVIAEFGGRETLVVWHPESLNGLNPADGKPIWSIPLPASSGMSVTAPLVVGDHIYVSGIGTPPTLLRVAKDGNSIEELWRAGRRKGIVAGNSSPVYHNGILYGVDTQGRLMATSFSDGTQLWSTFKASTGRSRESYSTGFLVRNDDRFFIFNERGELIISELTEDGYTEIGRQKLLEPTTTTYGRKVIWSHPAYAQKSIFARNDSEIVRVSLASPDKK